MECLFCKIINNEIPCYKIYENETTLAFLDIFPNANGHCLVIPKKHVESFSKADSQIVCDVAKAKLAVIGKLTKLNPKGFNFVSNDGNEAFQEVLHYHEHIIPKYKKEEGFTFKINKVNLDDVNNIYNKLK
ncbi:histidine triad protein [Williamsoniiplasma somnilux]|uniref:Histidine triad protein n=1 Tax=Williamsoniiplasma somnilux TaxID=215578 RepID=A0A2K8NY12_9MOLU|nr:HIT domain-containing protein [Williamsoniiplasma somnilux]ATZ18634.1 histidine triad protein [Williamsoniiplasma somnilux]